MTWLAAIVRPQTEIKAASALAQSGVRLLLPWAWHGQKLPRQKCRRWLRRPLFGGYVFIKTECPSAVRRLRYAEQFGGAGDIIRGWVSTGGRPNPIPEPAMSCIEALCYPEPPLAIRDRFQIGDVVAYKSALGPQPIEVKATRKGQIMTVMQFLGQPREVWIDEDHIDRNEAPPQRDRARYAHSHVPI